MATPLYNEEDKQNFPMNDLRLFTLTNPQGKRHKKSSEKSILSHTEQFFAYGGVQLFTITKQWLKLHSQIGLKPIHNPDFMQLQLSVGLMLIQCACKFN